MTCSTKRQNAQEAYDADYRFAQAPICPTVRARSPATAQVTLYWDNGGGRLLRLVHRRFGAVPGLDPNDFEGYRVYRATDPAFLDARSDHRRVRQPERSWRPIAQFDKIDGRTSGFHPVADRTGRSTSSGTDVRDPGEAGRTA